MLKKVFFSNREPCPCSSGLRFKDCCKNKIPKTFHSQGEMINFFGKMAKKSQIKMCLYKECTAKPKNVINAHALQENRILNKLAVNNHIMMQDTAKEPVIIEIEKGRPEPFCFLSDVHIKNATTAPCFCGTHDDALFEKIEKSKYTLDSLDTEQLFLFAYKTFAFELYSVITAQKYYINMFANISWLTKEISAVRSYRNNALKLDDFQLYKNFFDNAISRKIYSGLESVVLEIPSVIQFANYMSVAPPFDIKGRKIKSVNKKIKG